MNPLVLLALLALLVASSGFYFGGPALGGGAVGIIITACVLTHIFVEGHPAKPRRRVHRET